MACFFIDKYFDENVKSQILDIAKEIFKTTAITLKDKENVMGAVLKHLKTIQGQFSRKSSSPTTKFANIISNFSRGMKAIISDKALDILLSLKSKLIYKRKYRKLLKHFKRYASDDQKIELNKKAKIN